MSDRQPNAFEINVVGHSSTPFPFVASWLRDDISGVIRLDLAALRVREVADLVVEASGPFLVVYDVGHYETSDGKAFLDLSTVAHQRSVPHRALDARWAAYKPSYDEPSFELIVIASGQFPRLVEDLTLYELSLLSLRQEPTDEEVRSILLDAKANEPSELAALPNIDLALSIHDDCYVYVQSRDREHVLRFAGRGLASFAETIARRDGVDAAVADPPTAICAPLLSHAPDWLADQAQATVADGHIRVPLAQASWRLGDPMPETQAAVADYDLATAEWNWF